MPPYTKNIYALLFATCLAASPAEFEAVSVKPSTSTQHGVWTDGSPGRLRMMSLSLAELVAQAYDVKDYQVAGPGWIKNTRYDVMAKVPDAAAELPGKQRWEQIRAMEQTMLADRFKLAFHGETRDLQAYELVVGKNGARIHELGPNPGDNVMLDWKSQSHFSAKRMPMSQLVEILISLFEGPVLDRTGIKGVFDITLDWAPEKVAAANPEETRPSLAAAVQEQLGLKLEARRSPIEVLVVDHAEPASGN
jgi:uncharacterized protein (TIGR03435 family)